MSFLKMLVIRIGRRTRNQNFAGLKRANDIAWGSTFLHNARTRTRMRRTSFKRSLFIVGKSHPKIQLLWLNRPNWFHKVTIAANRSPLHPRGLPGFPRALRGHQLLKMFCIVRGWKQYAFCGQFDPPPPPLLQTLNESECLLFQLANLICHTKL